MPKRKKNTPPDAADAHFLAELASAWVDAELAKEGFSLGKLWHRLTKFTGCGQSDVSTGSDTALVGAMIRGLHLAEVECRIREGGYFYLPLFHEDQPAMADEWIDGQLLIGHSLAELRERLPWTGAADDVTKDRTALAHRVVEWADAGLAMGQSLKRLRKLATGRGSGDLHVRHRSDIAFQSAMIRGLHLAEVQRREMAVVQ